MGQPAAYQGLTTDCILSICTYSILVLYCSDQYADEPGELLKCQVTQPHYVGVRIPPPREKGQFWRDTSLPLVQYMEYAA